MVSNKLVFGSLSSNNSPSHAAPPSQPQSSTSEVPKSPVKIYQNIVCGPIHFPTAISEAARSLLEKLLDRDPSTRCGSRQTGGAGSVLSHVWFDSIVWEELMKMNSTFAPSKIPSSQTGCKPIRSAAAGGNVGVGEELFEIDPNFQVDGIVRSGSVKESVTS